MAYESISALPDTVRGHLPRRAGDLADSLQLRLRAVAGARRRSDRTG